MCLGVKDSYDPGEGNPASYAIIVATALLGTGAPSTKKSP